MELEPSAEPDAVAEEEEEEEEDEVEVEAEEVEDAEAYSVDILSQRATEGAAPRAPAFEELDDLVGDLDALRPALSRLQGSATASVLLDQHSQLLTQLGVGECDRTRPNFDVQVDAVLHAVRDLGLSVPPAAGARSEQRCYRWYLRRYRRGR